MGIDWDKPVQTRDGREVAIHTIGGRSQACPVVGEYRDSGGSWACRRWTHDGRYLSNRKSEDDLVNVPQKHTVWLNVYARDSACIKEHDTRKDADEGATRGRIACIEVTFTEGEGLC